MASINVPLDDLGEMLIDRCVENQRRIKKAPGLQRGHIAAQALIIGIVEMEKACVLQEAEQAKVKVGGS